MFYAVGVGPCDTMWMTREACAVLEACPVIAAPQTASGEMLALSIAQGAAELGGKPVLPLSFAMSRDAAVRAAGRIDAAAAPDPAASQSLPGTHVLITSRKAPGVPAAALSRHGLAEDSAMGADCGLPTQQVFETMTGLPEKISYFATVIVPDSKE